jgi:hypothetical protein
VIRVDLVGDPRGDEVEREIVGMMKARRPFRAESRAHPLQLAGGETVVEREHRRDVDRDRFRVPLLDLRFEHLPLFVAPQLGLRLNLTAGRPGGGLRRTNCLEDAAL